MKIVFCGTPKFAVASLKSLLNSSHEVVGVITQPDRPAGRGRKLHISPVKELALSNNIPVSQPLKIGDPESLENLTNLAPDIIVVVAYGQFLPKSVLYLPKYDCINVHASLLPSYRGAAPINWAIIRGERQTGVTTMGINSQMDGGDILLKQATNIDPQETAGTLHDKLSTLGADILITTLDQIEAGTAVYHSQDEIFASYAPSLQKDDLCIHWEQSAQEIDCFVRGLNPLPTARTYLQNEPFKVLSVQISEEEIEGESAAGKILKSDKKKGILVGTGTVPVWLKTIQPPNRALMQASDYVSGLHASLEGKILTSG